MKRPWLRFLLIGALLFAADAWREEGRAQGAPLPRLDAAATDEEVWLQEALSRRLHETDVVARRRLAMNMRFALPEDPRSDDALVAEALELGMHRSDRVLHRRLVQRLELEVVQRVRERPPTTAELTAYLEAHAERFGSPARVRIAQVHLRDRAGALALLPTLAPRADAASGRGDPLPIPSELPLHSESELASRLGPAFARAVFGLAEGVWSGPIASPYGHHLVFVSERREALRPRLESVRGAVRESLLADRAQAAVRAELERLRRRWGAGSSGDPT